MPVLCAVVLSRILLICAKYKLVLDELVDAEHDHLVADLGDLTLVLWLELVEEVRGLVGEKHLVDEHSLLEVFRMCGFNDHLRLILNINFV